MKKWMRILIFLGALTASVVSLFIVVMYFRRDRYWTPDRFGGLHVALVCIPIGAVSYGLATFYAIKWLGPILRPILRAYLPPPDTMD